MLPPLTIADNKSSFFSRKSINARVSGDSSRGNIGPSPRSKKHLARNSGATTSRPVEARATTDDNGSTRSPTSDMVVSSTALDDITMIPREFFVVETNVVLPHNQYSSAQYLSTFNAPRALWETIVFPALTPQTRQQVLYLRQALEKLRAPIVVSNHHDDKMLRTDRAKMLEYSKEEVRIYSICFHELTRQMKFICKEQSELLCEIREHFDAVFRRLVGEIERLDANSTKQQQEIDELASRYEEATRRNAELLEKLSQKQERQDHMVSTDGTPSRSPCFQLRRPVVLDQIDSDDAWEAEWRRQRRGRRYMSDVTRGNRRDMQMEENWAAACVQHAFQKYKVRKEQHRLAFRQEKQTAALDIQRSYRGFRERRLALHRRAILQTIYQRRKENAAVELLQTNVRAYLLKRRRMERSRKIQVKKQQTLDRSHWTENPTLSYGCTVPTSQDINVNTKQETAEQSHIVIKIEEKDGSETTRTTVLIELINKLRELTAIFSRHSQVRPDTFEDTTSNRSHGDEGLDEDDTVSKQHIQQVEDVVELVHAAIVSYKELNKATNGDGPGDRDNREEERATEIGQPAHSNIGVPILISQSTSTTSLLKSSSEYELKPDDQVWTSNMDLTKCMQAELPEVPLQGSSMDYLDNDDDMHNRDFHLDDCLRDSITYYLPSRADDESVLQLERILASRDKRKKLARVKQFISDIYDTIMGTLKEISSSRLHEFIKLHCGLAVSFTEWEEHLRSIEECPTLVSIKSFDLEGIIREHFHCQLGLKQLMDDSISNLFANIELFIPIDPDVKRFHDFLHHERSQTEFLFFIVCRYLASHLDTARSASPNSFRHPVFHPHTMRESISISRALEAAKFLFRVDDEPSIVQTDSIFIEPENSVYRRHIPSSGYQQFETIVTTYLVPVEFSTGSGSDPSTIDDHTDFVHSTQSSSLIRPTNFNLFHSSQYNSTAPRSPLVLRPQRPSAQGATSIQPSASFGASKWISFDEFIDILQKYRSEMNHFHILMQWIRGLFTTALDASSRNATMEKHDKLLDDAAFVETLWPFSLGPTERELRNVFHNALKQRHLQIFMPSRVFISVVLLMLRNKLLSVNSYPPLEKKHRQLTHSNEEVLCSNTQTLSIREQDEQKAWMSLALKWRTQETVFESKIEQFYQELTTDKSAALRLLQLRQELYDLFKCRSGKAKLQRAYDVYELLSRHLKGEADNLESNHTTSCVNADVISLSAENGAFGCEKYDQVIVNGGFDSEV